MRTLIAFDKFKDALTAAEACDAAARALRETHPDWTLDLCPLTDGGEGFATVLTQAAGGELRHASVAGPRGGSVDAVFGIVRLDRLPAAARRQLALPAGLAADATIGIVEMAAASGLALLARDERDLWQTTTAGTGQLIAAAAAAGAAVVLLGVGGSATNDLGLGALAALGCEPLDAAGQPVDPAAPANWSRIATFGGRLRAELPPLRIACDVTNPLLGANGCSAVYGPQKGLRAADLPRMENDSARIARLLLAHVGAPAELVDAPGAGAAGGIAFGLMAAAGARLLPGYELVEAWLGLDERIAAAELVLTGEGRFDASSLSGKGPGAVAARAAALGRRTHVFAGAVSVAACLPFATHAITPSDLPLAAAMRAAADLLAATVRREFA